MVALLAGAMSSSLELAKATIADLKSASVPQEKKEKVAAKLVAQAQLLAGAACLVQCGVVAPLVATLRDGTDGGQREAASALATIASHGREQRRAVASGRPIGPLVAILRGGSNKAAMLAGAALAALSVESAQALAVIREGGLPGLMRLLRVGTADAQAHGATCIATLARAGADFDDDEADAQPESHAIRQMVAPSCNREAQDFFASAGAVPLLLGMLQNGRTAQVAAAHALSKVAAYHEANQSAIAREGGLPKLLALLHGGSIDAETQAAGALAELARGHLENQEAVARAGGIGPLLALLGSTQPAARARAAHALALLSRFNHDNQAHVTRANGVPTLVGLLSGGSPPEVQAMAAMALAEISRGNGDNQSGVAEHGGIESLVQLLARSPSDAVRAEVVGALWVLADRHASNTDSIATVGGIPAAVDLLASGGPRATEHAANAIAALGVGSLANQGVAASQLVALLGGESAKGKLRAAACLWRLVRENSESQHAIASAGAVSDRIRLLKEGSKEASAYALWSLRRARGHCTVINCTHYSPWHARGTRHVRAAARRMRARAWTATTHCDSRRVHARTRTRRYAYAYAWYGAGPLWRAASRLTRTARRWCWTRAAWSHL